MAATLMCRPDRAASGNAPRAGRLLGRTGEKLSVVRNAGHAAPICAACCEIKLVSAHETQANTLSYFLVSGMFNVYRVWRRSPLRVIAPFSTKSCRSRVAVAREVPVIEM